jgi:hypothetical protein
MVGASHAAARHKQYQQLSSSNTTETGRKNKWFIRKQRCILDTDADDNEKVSEVPIVRVHDFRSRLKLVKVNNW